MIDRFLAWVEGIKFRWYTWLQSWEMSHKESQGYRCQHRIMSNGRKECGDD